MIHQQCPPAPHASLQTISLTTGPLLSIFAQGTEPKPDKGRVLTVTAYEDRLLYAEPTCRLPAEGESESFSTGLSHANRFTNRNHKIGSG